MTACSTATGIEVCWGFRPPWPGPWRFSILGSRRRRRSCLIALALEGNINRNPSYIHALHFRSLQSQAFEELTRVFRAGRIFRWRRLGARRMLWCWRGVVGIQDVGHPAKGNAVCLSCDQDGSLGVCRWKVGSFDGLAARHHERDLFK